MGDYDPSGEDIARTVRDTLTRYVDELSCIRAIRAVPPPSRALFFHEVAKDPADREGWDDACEAAWQAYADRRALAPDFDRLAVTPEQIAELELPYRPVKGSDPRTRGFAGAGSVEIEAIPRRTILAILRDRIERELDSHALKIARVAEESERAVLARIAEAMTA